MADVKGATTGNPGSFFVATHADIEGRPESAGLVGDTAEGEFI